jgi:7-cyano-7-deazaguanine synthase
MGAVLNLVLLSGGMDSATALASLVERRERCDALFIAFGQPAEAEERRAARKVAANYDVPLREIIVTGGSYQPGEIRGRNAFLIHLGLLSIAVTPALIFIGIHAGTTYRDCSVDFVELMRQSLNFHSDGAIDLAAPFVGWRKAEVFAQAQRLKVPIALTYSCEKGEGPCGTCLSCLDRDGLYAFSK